jgi:glutathione S-transferase
VLTLYEFAPSGNCHKVRLMLGLLGLAWRSVAVDGSARAQKSAAFLALNPFGQVPVLVDGTVTVRDSQSILVYLARRYGGEQWLPADPAAMAEVIAWLSVASYEVWQGPAMVRAFHKFGRDVDLGRATALMVELFGVLEQRLAARPWLALDRPTIADVAVYPYVALVPEGKVDLAPWRAIVAWLGRVRSLPGYVGMPGMAA